MAKMKTWVAVVIALAVAVVVLGVATIGGSVYWFTRHVQSRTTTSERAADEFTRTRARFASQQPLIEVRGPGDVVVHRTAEAVTTSSRVELTTLYAIAFDPDEEKMVRINIPFWLLRLGSRGRLRFGNGSLDSNVHVTLRDVEARGPGLLVDGHGPKGEQFMVWTE